MVKVEHLTMLASMEEQHDALIDELDALEARVDAALVACGAAPRVQDAVSTKSYKAQQLP